MQPMRGQPTTVSPTAAASAGPATRATRAPSTRPTVLGRPPLQRHYNDYIPRYSDYIPRGLPATPGRPAIPHGVCSRSPPTISSLHPRLRARLFTVPGHCTRSLCPGSANQPCRLLARASWGGGGEDAEAQGNGGMPVRRRRRAPAPESAPPRYPPPGAPSQGWESDDYRYQEEFGDEVYEDDWRRAGARVSPGGGWSGRGGPGADQDDDDGDDEDGVWGSSLSRAVFAALFALGISAGIWMDTALDGSPSNVASREVIDRQTPNPEICLANGASAMVLDQRLFVSLNPFNVYVAQTEVKPGCVLRPSNWAVLESRGLVTSEESAQCKKNMNTFGFVGDLRESPAVSCLYHSEDAENLFLRDPSKAALGDGFQVRDFVNEGVKGSSLPAHLGPNS